MDANQPVIGAADRGLIGDGVFEVFKVVDGIPFAWSRHMERLRASAAPLDMTIDMAAIEEGFAAVLGTGRLDTGSYWVRVTVTGGPAAMGKAERGHTPTVVVGAAPLPEWTSPCRAVVVPWTRNERGALAGLKTLSYIENGIALRYAHQRGGDEGIFANTVGNLCEGAGTNIFVVIGDEVRTPPLSAGALDGITRQLLLEWVPEIVVADVPMSALRECREVFVTSTSRDVQPVAEIDGERLPVVAGPLTSEIIDVFRARAAIDPDPAPSPGVAR